MAKSCSGLDCSKPRVARGYCRTHYSRVMKHGDPEYIRPNYLKRGDKCTLKDCSDKPYAKLLCRTHYDRKRAHGDPNITLHRTTCIIPDCNAKHAGLGYCSKHYARFSKYGDPHFLKEVQNKGRMKHRLYTRYRGMMDRCYYVRSYKYPRYGGRGIKVCGRWLDRINGFENYIIDIESLPNAYKSGWTIDRINNDGDYEPNNVRWASATVQANNQERILTKLSFIKETK